MQLSEMPVQIIENLRNKSMPIAIIGASNSKDKYGNIIVRNLLSKGFTVIPVNPKEDFIEGIRVSASLADGVPRDALVCTVVPPQVSGKVVDSAISMGFTRFWFQDGSWDPEVLRKAQAASTEVVHSACIMVVTNIL